MEIQEFLELCAGNWFSQRTSYHFEQEKADSNKSELAIEWLSADHQEVISLCQDYQINPQTTLGGTKVCWDTSVDWGKTKQTGATLIVLIPALNNSQSGQLLRTKEQTQASLIFGSYSLGNDEALTLTTETDGFYSEERIWFASPNLRLRSSLIKSSHGFSCTAFYSEIRKLLPKVS